MPASPLLLVDVGNTRVKWATAHDRGKIQEQGSSPTAEVGAEWVKTLASRYPAHRTVLACVVPRLGPAFQRAFAKRIEVVTGTSEALQLPFCYPRPAELGADRLVAAVVAHAEGVWPVIVVSCGTATAFTVLNEKGEFCGGVIAPGLQTQLASLIGATAQLPATSIHPPKRLPGTSTEEAIRAGVFLNFQGGAREIVGCLTKSFPGKSSPRLLLTGGYARHLTKVFDPAAEVRPLLVLEGLRMIGSRAFAPPL
jgi:type III pantothenate kinase